MPGRFSLYQDLTVEENLSFFATLFNTSIEENYALIKDIYKQLEPFKTRRAGKLSGGMKQKLALCCALIHKPTVLFLDEPTTGVDPVSRKEFWEMLKKLQEQNITILVSTPFLDEAVFCDRIALMQEGQLLAIDTPKQIVASYPYDLFAVGAENMSKLLKSIHQLDEKEAGYAFGEFAHVSFRKDSMTKERLNNYFLSQDLTDLKITKIEAKVEDLFIYLLKK
jgi:ABC-type multidrug transport system ATPase subunit